MRIIKKIELLENQFPLAPSPRSHFIHSINTEGPLQSNAKQYTSAIGHFYEGRPQIAQLCFPASHVPASVKQAQLQKNV